MASVDQTAAGVAADQQAVLATDTVKAAEQHQAVHPTGQQTVHPTGQQTVLGKAEQALTEVGEHTSQVETHLGRNVAIGITATAAVGASLYGLHKWNQNKQSGNGNRVQAVLMK